MLKQRIYRERLRDSFTRSEAVYLTSEAAVRAADRLGFHSDAGCVRVKYDISPNRGSYDIVVWELAK